MSGQDEQDQTLDKKEIEYIELIKIEKLWNNVDIKWKLDPKVNILVGKNGSGKTTILNILKLVCLYEHHKEVLSCLKIHLFLNDQYELECEKMTHDYKEWLKK